MFQCPGWMRKNFIPGMSAEGQRQKHKMEVTSKKVYWENNRVFQTLAPYWHYKRYFIRLTDAFFKYL